MGRTIGTDKKVYFVFKDLASHEVRWYSKSIVGSRATVGGVYRVFIEKAGYPERTSVFSHRSRYLRLYEDDAAVTAWRLDDQTVETKRRELAQQKKDSEGGFGDMTLAQARRELSSFKFAGERRAKLATIIDYLLVV